MFPFAQITSKVWGTFHKNGVEECLDQSLANLGVDYLDRKLFKDFEAKNRGVNDISVYLIHWPVALNPNGNHFLIPTCPDGKRDVLHDWKLQDTWKQMESVLKKGQ